MSWLDDMEATDPAYPDLPADTGGPPNSVPGTTPGQPALGGTALEEWRAQQGLRVFPEDYDRAMADIDQATAWTQTVIPSYAEQQRQLDWERAQDPWHEQTGPGYTEPPIDWDPGAPYEREAFAEIEDRNWRALQEADACARGRGLQVTERSAAPWSPQYQADAAAWGTGRGVEPDEPEAGA
jgi:hypothetical protein